MPDIPYPDAEQVLLDLLEQFAPTVTWLPDDFEPPVILVNRIGGAPDEDDITDYPVLLVSCFGSTRGEAWQLTGRCQQAIAAVPGSDVNGVLVDEADTVTGGQLEPDLEPDDRRVTSTYRLGLRRQYHLV